VTHGCTLHGQEVLLLRLVTHTQVFDPEKPVSLLFNACAAIDKLCGGTGCDCGSLGWERTYTSNEKYMCWEDNLGYMIMKVIIFALIGVVFHGPHGTGLHT
jgi:hypothetical protein